MKKLLLLGVVVVAGYLIYRRINKEMDEMFDEIDFDYERPALPWEYTTYTRILN